MQIRIASSTAIAPTSISAFDKALTNAGIANYNLIYLSSIIPPGATVKQCDKKVPSGELQGGWGDKLYVVIAESRVLTPNVEAWAGIGWVQDESTGEGLFVEHEGFSEQTIRCGIKDSLESMTSYRKHHKFGPINMEVCGITCERDPVTALVVAVYQSEGWSQV